MRSRVNNAAVAAASGRKYTEILKHANNVIDKIISGIDFLFLAILCQDYVASIR